MADIDSVVRNASAIARNLIQHDGRLREHSPANSLTGHRANEYGYHNGAIKKSSSQKEVFARENICDKVTLSRIETKHGKKSPKAQPGIIKFDKYPKYINEREHGIPFLIKLSASHLSILQLHGLTGKELILAATEYLDTYFHTEISSINNATAPTEYSIHKFSTLLQFLKETPHLPFENREREIILRYYVYYIKYSNINDDRLKNCKQHAITSKIVANVECTCVFQHLISIIKMQPAVENIDHTLRYNSLYEMCYSFLIILETARFYEKHGQTISDVLFTCLIM